MAFSQYTSKPLSPIDEDKSTTTQVIREVYEGDEHDTFENELEKALEAKVKYIIIEPQRLGDETARWIRVGNCLHKTAVVSGLASIVCGAIMPDRPVFSAPLSAISIFCTGLYTVSWNVDYCCQYQVETDPKKLEKIPDFQNFSSPIALVYTKNTRTKYLHRSVTLLATAFCAWTLYEAYK
ncbi:transmembrane protein 11 homolog, mitochondrial isoform X1 [Contarinia nasturtii]|uniref:transmembrane protein 11 homolog, mitochondrial isoform X1 n=1 Tax=Contarinia nasturtii TaxID=265458 RepID=UPI0012D3DAF3|nr:transmembrane protein 11 homolog, mitochondrial isoform X1 [Contarinia nasturtii]